jgi:hypothetical protein
VRTSPSLTTTSCGVLPSRSFRRFIASCCISPHSLVLTCRAYTFERYARAVSSTCGTAPSAVKDKSVANRMLSNITVLRCYLCFDTWWPLSCCVFSPGTLANRENWASCPRNYPVRSRPREVRCHAHGMRADTQHNQVGFVPACHVQNLLRGITGFGNAVRLAP